MPDRASVPRGVSRRYKKICQQIRERQPPASVARSIATQLEKDIKNQGKGGASLINHMSKYMSPLVDNSNLLSHIPNQWNDVYDEIDRYKELIEDGSQRFKEQAAQACYRVAINEEQGGCNENIEIEVQKEYRQAIWGAEIKDPLLIAEPEKTYDAMEAYLDQVDAALAEEIENRLLNGPMVKPALEEILEANIFSDL